MECIIPMSELLDSKLHAFAFVHSSGFELLLVLVKLANQQELLHQVLGYAPLQLRFQVEDLHYFPFLHPLPTGEVPSLQEGLVPTGKLSALQVVAHQGDEE